MRNLTERLEELEMEQGIRDALSICELQLEGTCWVVHQKLEGLARANWLTLSTDVISPHQLKKSMVHLVSQLGDKGLLPLPLKNHEVYEADLSILYFKNNMLCILIHIPTYYHHTLLNVYQYIPTPIMIKTNS